MAYKSFSMERAGRTLTVEVGRVAKQANGAALMHYGCLLYTSKDSNKDNRRKIAMTMDEKIKRINEL